MNIVTNDDKIFILTLNDIEKIPFLSEMISITKANTSGPEINAMESIPLQNINSDVFQYILDLIRGGVEAEEIPVDKIISVMEALSFFNVDTQLDKVIIYCQDLLERMNDVELRRFLDT